MTQKETSVNATSFAPLRNVLLASQAMEHLIQRDPNLPGLGAFCGPPGYGKSKAAAHVAVRHRCVYVEIRSHYTRKAFLLSILAEMGVEPERTVYQMVDQICEQLMRSQKPLILDEMDHAVQLNLVELVRDIYEGSGAPILMIGEEQFPKKLTRWGRFYDRVLAFTWAEPCDTDDARKLAKLYCPEVPIADEWLQRALKETRGITRRLCVNIEAARREAKKLGAKSIDLKFWGNRPFDTGLPPARGMA